MKIEINNKTITSTDFSGTETAWMIKDAISVLEYLRCKKKVVLGGDILTNDLEYSYDNWYYNLDTNKNHQQNLSCSIELAHKYISNYITKNGTEFYVVFVAEEFQQILPFCGTEGTVLSVPYTIHNRQSNNN